MSGRFHWRDASDALQRLTASERRALLLLARLPLLWTSAIAQLAGPRAGASVYRSVDRLETAGLVGGVRVALRPGPTPRLLYLTDLGLAAVALDQNVAPGPLAHRNRLRAADLCHALPGLPQLVATYELLAAVAVARPGRPDLLAWERPWRRRYQRLTGRQPVTVHLPACATLAWEGESAAYLLLPDRGTVPLRVWRATIGQLLTLRGIDASAVSPLIVATTDSQRASAWQSILDEASYAQSEAPFVARIATWKDLRAGLMGLEALSGSRMLLASSLVQRIRMPALGARQSGRPIPRLVGESLQVGLSARSSPADPAEMLQALPPADRALLDLLGPHPFLSAHDLAVALGWSPERVRQRRNRLIRQGLMRLVTRAEIGERAALGLVEVTAGGLSVVAAQQGLTLAIAVRYQGLAGGGPDWPVGPRRSLLQNLEHTLGVNAVFISLCRTARRLAAAGSDDAFLEWRSATACSRSHVRPDGYGIYCHSGLYYGFFLEYDRGTMSARDYREKFAAYHQYQASRRFEQDYAGFPTILVVTTDDSVEARIAQAARAVSRGWGCSLPILLTCEWRIYADPNNPAGLLGPVWREPGVERACRRQWMLGRVSASGRRR